MSNPLFSVIIVFAIIESLIIFFQGWIIARSVRKEKQLRNGQAEWKRVAEEAANRAVAAKRDEQRALICNRDLQSRLASAGAELQKRTMELARVSDSATVENEVLMTLIQNEWAVVNHPKGLGFCVVPCLHNAPIVATGTSYVEAIRNALIAKRRAQEGLVS